MMTHEGPRTTVSPAATHTETSLTRGEWLGYSWGFVCIFAGGLVAAVTGPLAFEKGSWLAAYLVLVAGIAQLVLSKQRILLNTAITAPPGLHLRLTTWAVGNLLVMAGSHTRLPIIVDLGGITLVVALAAALVHSRTAQRRGLAWIARAFYVALLVSIPIGLVLAQIRAA